MKIVLKNNVEAVAKYLSFYKTPEGGGDGLPEGPKDYKSLALDTIREVQNASFPDQQSEGYLFLQAAARFITDLPSFPDETDAVPLAFFINAQLSVVKENVLEFLEHINQQISENPQLKSVNDYRVSMIDSLESQRKYYDGIFDFWHTHEIFYKALEKVQRRRQ